MNEVLLNKYRIFGWHLKTNTIKFFLLKEKKTIITRKFEHFFDPILRWIVIGRQTDFFYTFHGLLSSFWIISVLWAAKTYNFIFVSSRNVTEIKIMYLYQFSYSFGVILRKMLCTMMNFKSYSVITQQKYCSWNATDITNENILFTFLTKYWIFKGELTKKNY